MAKLLVTGGTSSALLFAAFVLLILSSVQGALIDLINQCGSTITACATCQQEACGDLVNCYVLNGGGGFQQLDVSGNWPGGVIWGFPSSSGNPSDGNNAKPQADLAEFNIASGQDFYDISVVNAYNLPMRISPTFIAPGDPASGLHCGSPVCSIGDLNGFCTSPNKLTGGPGDGCQNVDGPGLSPTPGTEKFANACPEAVSYSTDTPGHIYGCQTGSNYEVVFCPVGSSVIREVVPESFV